MNIEVQLQAIAQQQSAAVKSDGQEAGLRSTRAGQLLTADWKTELVLAGRAFNVTVGGISAGGDVALITGGGAGTTIDSDEPEMAISTPVGYYHIPLGFTCATQQDPGAADADEANIILFADVTQAAEAPVIASATLETPQNLLDGGPASISAAQSAVTTALAAVNPVCSILLGYSTSQAAQVTGAGTVVLELKLDFDPSYPTILAGPCIVVACWGGTNAATGACSYNWAEVPANRVE